MDHIDEWRRGWIQERVQCSRLPPAFWQGIVEALLAGRKFLHGNPQIPVGRYARHHSKALEMMVTRNNQGVVLDQYGNVEAALVVYEISIGDEFPVDQPYVRLRDIYTQRGWPEDARRVYRAYLAVQQEPGSASALNLSEKLS